MKNNKHTTLEKIGLTLLIAGSLLALIPILVICFKAGMVLGTIILGIVTAVVGFIILLRE